MSAVTLSIQGQAAVQRALELAPQVLDQEMLATMTAVTMHLQAEVQDAWPVGVFGSRQRITSDAFSTPAGVLGVVGSPDPYAPVIEFGRKPGSGISELGRKSLALWVSKVLGVAERDVARVTWAVARKIKRRGIAPKGVMTKTFERQRAHIAQMFEQAAQRALQRAMQQGGSS